MELETNETKRVARVCIVRGCDLGRGMTVLDDSGNVVGRILSITRDEDRNFVLDLAGAAEDEVVVVCKDERVPCVATHVVALGEVGAEEALFASLPAALRAQRAAKRLGSRNARVFELAANDDASVEP